MGPDEEIKAAAAAALFVLMIAAGLIRCPGPFVTFAFVVSQMVSARPFSLLHC